jgi:ribonucleoside-diphosphate reductase alpha chain
MDGGTYRQAPYESMTEFEYHDMVANMPLGIDWDKLVEGTDNVEGAQQLACTAGVCEI